MPLPATPWNKRHGCSPVHGVSTGTPTYRSWQNMRRRCNNPNTKDYPRYGGRGIKVCSRWDSFENFVTDMGERPTTGHTIDRIDNDGPYSPENCRWATNFDQQQTRHTSRVVEFAGWKMNVSQWARLTGIGRTSLANRLNSGWPVEKALTEPCDSKRRRG